MSTTLTEKLPTADPAAPKQPLTKHKRILLVEGDGFTRLVLLLRLRLAGFAVDFTSNGDLGLTKLRTCHPDILLIELKLCGMSGLELIQAARKELGFSRRPVYIYTQLDKISRSTRKQLQPLNVTVFDKDTVSREELVQIFATTFPNVRPWQEQANTPAEEEEAPEIFKDMGPAIQEILAGVRHQSQLLAKCKGNEMRAANGSELLSRVRSFASCAEAAHLPNLARQAKALAEFLTLLGKEKEGYTDQVLNTITRAVEVMSKISSEKNGKEHKLTHFSAVIFDEVAPSNKALKEALTKAGFNAVGFDSAARTREHLTFNRTDVIVVNVLLPEAHQLSLVEIRRLPFHIKTPVIFGPESIIKRPIGDDLPTDARRFDREALLVAETIVKALNEVQFPTPLEAAATAAKKAPVPRPSAPVVLPFDDGFTVFSQAAPPEIRSAPAPAPAAPAAPAVNHLPLNWAIEEDQPIFRKIESQPPPAQSSVPAPDPKVQEPEALPESPLVWIQNDIKVVAMTVNTESTIEQTPAAQPEPIPLDQAAPIPFPTAAPIESSQVVTNNTLILQQNHIVVAEQPAAAIPNNNRDMNEQLQASAEYTSQGDGNGNGQNHSRQDLIARVCAAEMALHRTQGMLDRKDQAIEALRQQLADANAAAQQANANLSGSPQNVVSQVAQARCAELEQEVATLRQALESLNANGGQQQGNPQVEAELRQQLDAANSGWQQNANACQDAQGRCAQLEQELATVRQSHDELANKLAAEQKVSAQTAAQFQQLEAANAAWQQNAHASQDAQGRCAQLEQELATMRQLRDELANKLAAEQKVSTHAAAQLKELAAKSAAGGSGDSDVELQLRQAVAALAKATAELAQERGQRQRSEQRSSELNTRLQTMHNDLSRTLQAQHDDLARIDTLEEQTRQATQALEQKTSELEQHRTERLLAEEQLHKAKGHNTQLQKDVAFLEEANKKFEGSRQELETKLENSLANQRDSEARLQQEKAERLRLSEALDAIQRKAGDSSERDLEFSKLQSMLQHEQVERNRKEAQLVHVRHSAVDAAQAARALRANMRRQVREPVDNLVVSARSLLELEMGDAQKKIAAAVLEDVLLVQTRLREPDNAGEPAESAPGAES